MLLRLKDAEDEAEPSGNSVAALNLLRLSQLTGDEALRHKAAQTSSGPSPRRSTAPRPPPRNYWSRWTSA